MMTNLQLWLTVALPIIVILVSLTINLFQLSAVRDDIREMRADLKLLTGKVYEMMGDRR